MKGTFFQKPLEFRLSVEGESWRQGGAIEGALFAKNHGASAVPLAGVSVYLARGILRKVHQKADDAFEIISSLPAPPSAGDTLEAQKEMSFPWKFKTERNGPITDNLSSLFLVYGQAGSGGDSSSLCKLGQLSLNILPDEVITQFLDTMKTGFRFVLKALKWSKGAVEAKLAPPDARGFARIEQLLIGFRFEGESLRVEYAFKLKKIEAGAAAVELQKQKSSFTQSYEPALYRTPSGRFDHESVERGIREILDQVESKTLL